MSLFKDKEPEKRAWVECQCDGEVMLCPLREDSGLILIKIAGKWRRANPDGTFECKNYYTRWWPKE